MSYITFARKELFSFRELEYFFDSNPVTRAELLAEKLEQHLIINKSILYLYKPINTTYTILKTDHVTVLDYLLMFARQFIVNSYEILDEKYTNLFNKMYQKNEVFKLDYYRDFIIDIFCKLTYEHVVFDSNKNEVHYKNGFADIKTKKFAKRDPEVHFITIFDDHEYHDDEQEDEQDDEDEEQEDEEDKEEEEDEQDDEDDETVPKKVKSQFTKQQFKDLIDLL